MNFNYVLSKLKLDKETLPKNIFISKKNFLMIFLFLIYVFTEAVHL